MPNPSREKNYGSQIETREAITTELTEERTHGQTGSGARCYCTFPPPHEQSGSLATTMNPLPFKLLSPDVPAS